MIVGRRADVVEVALLLAGVLSLRGVLVLVRFGVTAYMAAGWGWIALLSCPTGLQFSAWHQNGGQVMAAVVLLVAVYGFHSALGGRPLLARGGDEF
jgi:hypothetical protein